MRRFLLYRAVGLVLMPAMFMILAVTGGAHAIAPPGSDFLPHKSKHAPHRPVQPKALLSRAKAPVHAASISAFKVQVSKEVVPVIHKKNCETWLDPTKGFIEKCEETETLVDKAESPDSDTDTAAAVEFKPEDDTAADSKEWTDSIAPLAQDPIDDPLPEPQSSVLLFKAENNMLNSKDLTDSLSPSAQNTAAAQLPKPEGSTLMLKAEKSVLNPKDLRDSLAPVKKSMIVAQLPKPEIVLNSSPEKAVIYQAIAEPKSNTPKRISENQAFLPSLSPAGKSGDKPAQPAERLKQAKAKPSSNRVLTLKPSGAYTNITSGSVSHPEKRPPQHPSHFLSRFFNFLWPWGR